MLSFTQPALILCCVQASLLRQLIASPRLQHAETNLDLCYVCTPSLSSSADSVVAKSTKSTIIAMSMPAHSYPKRAYRNPLDKVLAFLQRAHGSQTDDGGWKVFELRAEGTGYTDEQFLGRIFHAPFPDHHPPPFALIPRVVEAMRDHLLGGQDRVAVVHCKGSPPPHADSSGGRLTRTTRQTAGKGRSGTISCAYLISEEGYTAVEALAQFTRARMRPGFGEGVSIPSQRRYVTYVEQWCTRHNKSYTERRVRVHAVHIFGLRFQDVRVALQGFVDQGKRIRTFHTFTPAECTVMSPPPSSAAGAVDVILEPAGGPVVLPTNDANIDFERRTVWGGGGGGYGGRLGLVTSIAHVWFNAFFEAVFRNASDSSGGSGASVGADSGVFEIDWKAMDGFKGTTSKGVQLLDRLQVVWSVEPHDGGGPDVAEPAIGQSVPNLPRADTGLPRP